jgi:hypothetical protein
MDTVCSVSLTSGFLRRITPAMASSSQSLSAHVAEARADGVQLLQLVDAVAVSEPSSPPLPPLDDPNEDEGSEPLPPPSSPPPLVTADTINDYSSLLTKALPRLSGHDDDDQDGESEAVRIGAISVGEVLLKTLQGELEKSGVSVEYKLIPGGAILLCAGQVIVRKENENDFVIEGPPCQAYFQIKNAIYRQFAFV